MSDGARVTLWGGSLWQTLTPVTIIALTRNLYPQPIKYPVRTNTRSTRGYSALYRSGVPHTIPSAPLTLRARASFPGPLV